MPRSRSIDERFHPYIARSYIYWTLMISKEEQRFLGRALVWLVREGEMQRLTDLEPYEREELFLVMKDHEAALDRLWKPDHMNYSWLGNGFEENGGRGHIHLIPRYKEPRTFAGVVFEDHRWGETPWPYEPLPLNDDVLFKIRDAVKGQLP